MPMPLAQNEVNFDVAIRFRRNLCRLLPMASSMVRRPHCAFERCSHFGASDEISWIASADRFNFRKEQFMVFDLRRRMLTALFLSLALLCLIVGVAQADGEVPSTITVHLAHFAPFADSMEKSVVSVYANGEPLVFDLNYGETQTISLTLGLQIYLPLVSASSPSQTGEAVVSKSSLPSAFTDDEQGSQGVILSIVDQSTGATIYEQLVTFEWDEYIYPLAIIGGANAAPVEIMALPDGSRTGNAGYLFAHLAPFADVRTPGSTAVDLCVQNDGDNATPTKRVVGNGQLEYGEVSTYLPDGEHGDQEKLIVARAGTACADVLLELEPFALADDGLFDLFLIGLLPDDANFATTFVPVPNDAPVYCRIPYIKPLVRQTGSQESGNVWRYTFSVDNWVMYSDDLFTPAPDLPPCGNNTAASRTWIRIYDQNDKFIYGFCALGQAADMVSLWYPVPKTEPTPESVYIDVYDRRCNMTYRSDPIAEPLHGRYAVE
jgi:hypothetical protein